MWRHQQPSIRVHDEQSLLFPEFPRTVLGLPTSLTTNQQPSTPCVSPTKTPACSMSKTQIPVAPAPTLLVAPMEAARRLRSSAHPPSTARPSCLCPVQTVHARQPNPIARANATTQHLPDVPTAPVLHLSTTARAIPGARRACRFTALAGRVRRQGPRALHHALPWHPCNAPTGLVFRRTPTAPATRVARKPLQCSALMATVWQLWMHVTFHCAHLRCPSSAPMVNVWGQNSSVPPTHPALQMPLCSVPTVGVLRPLQSAATFPRQPPVKLVGLFAPTASVLLPLQNVQDATHPRVSGAKTANVL